MDSLSKNFLQELECPVCMEYMMPPITMCENGHSQCTACKGRLSKCPICNGKLMNIHNIILESLAEKVQYPCKFRDHGCPEAFPLAEISSHQELCQHGHYKCPFFIQTVGCGWDGPAAFIRNHIRSQHAGTSDSRDVSGVHQARLLNFDCYSSWCQAVFTLNQVFFRFSRIRNRFLYSCVLFVGPRDDARKYSYRLTMNTPDGKSSVCTFHETSYYDIDVEELFSNGKCAIFHMEFAKSCRVIENELVLEEEILCRQVHKNSSALQD